MTRSRARIRCDNNCLRRAGRMGTERGRFELPLPLRADRFSKPAHSTTLPPLLITALNRNASVAMGQIGLGIGCPVMYELSGYRVRFQTRWLKCRAIAFDKVGEVSM